jgi:hypothetical protein
MPLSSFHGSEAHSSGHAEQRPKLGGNDGGKRLAVSPVAREIWKGGFFMIAGRRGMNRVLDPYGQAVIQLAVLMPRRLNQDGCD